MIRSLKVNDKLSIVQEEINIVEPSTLKEKESTNHILIYDRSGSMYGLLPKLTEDLIDRMKLIPVNDTVSIGYFSGEGQYNFILKGFKVTENKDYSILEKAIRNNSTTIGLTCFSEILNETSETIIKDLSIFSNRFALTFLSDGYPVVSNYDKEIASIFDVISKLNNQITASLLVGYGNYYNKELMTKMAEGLGGSLTHSSDLPTFNIALTNFIVNSQDTENKIKIPVTEWFGNIYFSINGNNINVYQPKDGHILYTPIKGRGKNYLYTITSSDADFLQKAASNNDKLEYVKLTDANVGNDTKIEAFIKGLYAASYILTQRAKTDQTIEILSALGDTALIDIVNNAFTNDEYGNAEKRMEECIVSPKKRFLNGRNTSYLPKPDAFCLLDLIDLLCEDEQAYLYTQDPSFKYKRIGVASVTKEGYPKFTPDKNNKCRFSTLSWNESKLNLSVLMNITGSVKLPKNYKKNEFISNKFDTFVWRNYTIVKDGFLNTSCLPITMSESTFNKLSKEGLINTNVPFGCFVQYIPDTIYPLDLSKLPIINRFIADGKTSAKVLFSKIYEELKLKALLKVYKYFKSGFEPETSAYALTGLTDDQIKYLDELGITNKGFNPPSEEVTSTDFYYAKEFNIKMKKLSSLPKITDVLDKMTKGKNLTESDKLIQEGLINYNAASLGKKEWKDANKLEWLNENIRQVQKNMIELRKEIQRTKFAILLAKRWFDEFDSRENCTLDVNGVTFTVSLDSKKVEI
jgi:hypothetical protein